MAKTIVIDEQRCLGCKTCTLECALVHSGAPNLYEAISGSELPQPRIHVEPAGRFGVPLQCRHCQDAPCMAICPTKAIHRPTELGPVLIDPHRCIGCRFCMSVCPFGVIDLSRDGKAMVKCDLCWERTERGLEPACVAGCPTGALQYADEEEWNRNRRRSAAQKVTVASQRADEVVAERTNGR